MSAVQPWLAALATSLAVSVATAAFAFRRRQRFPAARAFALIPLSHATWTALEIAQILAPSRDAKLLFDGLQWLAGLGVVGGSLWFGYEYAARRLRRRLWLPVLALPLPVIALLLTEPLHHRYHPDAWISLTGASSSLEYAWSWTDWFLIAYGYLMLTASWALVIRKLARQPAAYVNQTVIVLLGLALPPIAALVALAMDLRTFGQRDPAPMLFGLGDLIVAFGLFRRGLFDLAPVACEAVVAGLADGVVVCDTDGRIVDANAALCTALRCNQRALIGRPVAEAFRRWPMLAGACAGHRERGELEIELRREPGVLDSGVRRFMDISASPLHDRRSRPIGRAVVLRDLSDRKQAERELEGERALLETRVRERTAELERTLEALRAENNERMRTEHALRASERRFRAIFDHSFELVGLLDRGGRLLAANRTALAFAGVPESAVIDRPFWETPWWAHSATMREQLRAAIPAAASGEVVRFEVTHMARDRRARYFDFSLKAAYDDQAVEFLIAEGRDVTELRRAEHENVALAEKLQHTHRLESIGRLAGGVAHDFNNLLTAITGSVEVARMALGPDQRAGASDALAVIDQAADSAAQLTRQLLTFGRRQAVSPRVIDAAAGVTQFQPLLERVVGPRVRLEVRLAPDGWPICIDEGQLEQILVNLAVNARDAMPEGGTVEISAGNVTLKAPRTFQGLEAAPGDYLELRVRDTGVGMKDTVLERMFEPFFTTKASGKGTGLGLSVIYGIARQNGGYIEVRSRLGAGTEFHLLFPRAHGPLEAAVEDAPAPPAASPTGSERIMLIEDQQAVRVFVRDLLEGLGYDVRAYADGEAALIASLDGDPPDMVLADVVLPGCSGVEIADRLRRRWPQLPVLLVSGYADDALAKRKLDGVHFLAKPFRAETLAAKVRAILDGRRVAEDAKA